MRDSQLWKWCLRCSPIDDGRGCGALCVPCPSTYPFENRESALELTRLSLIKENRWRAQRYGLDDGLVDFGKGKVIPWSELLNEMLDLIYEDAVALNAKMK